MCDSHEFYLRTAEIKRIAKLSTEISRTSLDSLAREAYPIQITAG